jgi:uncharacterized protein YjbI with pentapeptide repeats
MTNLIKKYKHYKLNPKFISAVLSDLTLTKKEKTKLLMRPWDKNPQRPRALHKRLELHRIWLLDRSLGKRFEVRANENFEGECFSGMDFSHTDLRESDLSFGNFDYCKFIGADLSNSILESIWLNHANLQHTNLSSCYITSYWESFEYVNAISANFENISPKKDLEVLFKFSNLEFTKVGTKAATND